MEITGKITTILPLQSGMGRNGEWRSQDFIVETEGQYPKKVCINLFNDRINKFPINVGDTVQVSFDIESREYNGRWYTTVRAWNVKNAQATAAMSPEDMPPPPGLENAPSASSFRGNFDALDDVDSSSDMPF